VSDRSDRSRDPFATTDRLLVDGTNLLHQMQRRPGAAPTAALLGRLRAAVPAAIAIELVFDGAPDRGLRGERIASGVSVRYSGGRSADDLLRSLVDEVRSKPGGAAASSRVLVVTDDRALRASLHERGARTAGSSWFLGRLERSTLSAPSVGNRKPPKPAAPPRASDDEDRPGWSPGRGATTKKGNPRRGRPSSGRMPG
jgi:rRNA-processing protein FCF1